MRAPGILWGGLLGFMAVLVPRPSKACASCACGDPTLTVMGTAQPFAGRLRLGVESRFRWDLAAGVEGQDRVELSEQRIAFEVAWAPLSELFVSVRAPLVRRDLEFADLSRADVTHIGDVELAAKWFVFRDQPFGSTHLVALEAGLELPTSPRQDGPDGSPLGFEGQLGSGSFDPSFGASYAWFSDPISLYASARALIPTAGRFDLRPGEAFLASVVAQAQATRWLAVRAGFDFRAEAAFEEDGVLDPHSGGAALFLTPELLWSAIGDLVVRLSVSMPAWLNLRGTQTEGPTMRLGVVFDV